MKVLDFKTIKGEFILLDLPKFNKNVTDAYVTHIDYNLNNVTIQDIDTGEYVFGAEFAFPVEIICSVKHMTEEQFAEVVDSTVKGGILACFKDYTKGYYSNSIFTAKESFESLIKSLGWYLFENTVAVPMHKSNNINEMSKYIEAESKTLYNPVLLKKV